MANVQIVPARKNNVEAQYVETMVPLYSYGCEKKIKKALSSFKGIYSVNVDHCQQKLTVWEICNKYDDVLETVRCKRKEAGFWNPEDNVALEDSKSCSSSPTPPPLFPHKDFRPSFVLTKVRSLSLKAWNKVFTGSYSF